MTVFQALVLGFIQGLTEFLPVSSSGHLALFQRYFSLPEDMLTFDIIVHAGTLVAVLLFFSNDLLKLLLPSVEALKERNIQKIPQIIWMLAIGTIPAVILGLLFEDYLETVFSSPVFIAIGFFITAGFVFVADKFTLTGKVKKEITWRDSLIIGFFQAIAIIPSISRSGSTIAASLWRGLDRQTAFTFSFLLSIPAIAGAIVFKISDIRALTASDIVPYSLGFLVSAAVGYLSLRFFKNVLSQNKLSLFGFYCVFLGILVLLLMQG